MTQVRNLNRPMIVELVDVLNSIRADYFGVAKSHADLVPTSALDTSGDGYVAATNVLVAGYSTHIASALTADAAGAHITADTTNTISAPVATSLASAITRANELKADYNLHRASTTFHKTADSTNVVTASDATDEASLLTLLADIETQLNAHFARVMVSTFIDVIPA